MKQGILTVYGKQLADGVIDMVISDHYLGELPNPEKSVSFKDKEAGIAGLEISLPVLYHLAITQGRLTMARFMEVISENPARIFGFGIPKRHAATRNGCGFCDL